MAEKSSLERLELLGRLSSITEELESIAKSAGKSAKQAPRMDFAGGKSVSVGKEPSLVRMFYEASRSIVVKNLLAGRCAIDCYVAGKTMGLGFAVKNHQHLMKVCRTLGMGPLIFKEAEGPQGHQIVVELKKGFTASFAETAKHPICYFEAGFLSGLTERVTKRRVDLQEMSCAGAGAKNCRFVSSQAPPEDEKVRARTKGAVAILPMDQYSEENVRLLTTLAAHALTAIENTLLFEKAKRQMVIDGLTGVYNHRYFQQAVRVELKRAERHRQPLAILMMDVDRFKRVNDVCGHPQGDRLLRMVGRVLTTLVRDIDVVARYGGDEFAIVLPQTDASGAAVVASRILGWLAKTHLLRHRGKNIRVSMSIGIAVRSKAIHEPSLLIDSADKALLRAKRNGQGQIVLAAEAGK